MMRSIPLASFPSALLRIFGAGTAENAWADRIYLPPEETGRSRSPALDMPVIRWISPKKHLNRARRYSILACRGCGSTLPARGHHPFTKGSPMRIVLLVATALFSVGMPAAYAATPSDPTSDDQKTLYALGQAISQSLGPFNLTETEFDMVKAGLTDGVLKRPAKVDMQVFGPKI